MKKLNLQEIYSISGSQASISFDACYISMTVTDKSVFTMEGCSFSAKSVYFENKMIHSGVTGSFEWNGEIIKVFPYLNDNGVCIGSMYLY